MKVFLCILTMLLMTAGEACALEVIYNATAGLMPEESCPPWRLMSSDTTQQALINQEGRLELRSNLAPHLFYSQYSDPAELPDTIVLEARLRVASEFTNAEHRAIATLYVTWEPNFRVPLYIGTGRMVLIEDSAQVYDSADVDTQGGFHTYRLEVHRKNMTARAYYDGDLVLEGPVTTSIPVEGTRVSFGDDTKHAIGITQWEYVAHNVASVKPQCAEITEPPVEVAEPPVEIPEPKVEIPEEPVETAEPPAEITEPTVEAIEAPVESVEPPTEVVETPDETSEPTKAPVETVDTPVETPEPTVEPVEAAKTPVEPPGAPAEVVEALVETAEPQAESVEASAEVVEAPVEPSKAPVENVDTPVKDEETAVIPKKTEWLAPKVGVASGVFKGRGLLKLPPQSP